VLVEGRLGRNGVVQLHELARRTADDVERELSFKRDLLRPQEAIRRRLRTERDDRHELLGPAVTAAFETANVAVGRGSYGSERAAQDFAAAARGRLTSPGSSDS